jgi:molybdenum cofactor cytidylyltransferase
MHEGDSTSGDDRRTGLAALVLAAGGSRRLGQSKQLLPVDGVPLLLHAVRKCIPVCPAGVVVVTGANSDEVNRLVETEAVQTVENTDWSDGLASSIRVGVDAVPAAADGVLLMVCDQTDLSADEFGVLAATWARMPRRIVASRYANTVGVPAIFPRNVFPLLAALRGDTGAKTVIEASEDAIFVDIPGAAVDIDTEQDLARLRDQGR